MNSAMAYPVRQYLMNRSRLLSAVRLPNNLFTDYAGTEVGSDLIILQKDTLSQREYTSLERSFVEVGTQADRDDAERVFRAYRRHRAYTWPCRYRSLRQAGTHLPA